MRSRISPVIPDNIFDKDQILRRSFTDKLVYFVNIKQFGRHRTAVRIFAQ